LVRVKSTAFTGGLGNATIATAELGGSLLVALLALVAPLLTLLVVIVLLWLAFRWWQRMSQKRQASLPD
jgi:hypothetical protein